MNRGRDQQRIFADDDDYQRFLDTLGEAAERFAVESHAYCLMPNRYKAIVVDADAYLLQAVLSRLDP